MIDGAGRIIAANRLFSLSATVLAEALGRLEGAAGGLCPAVMAPVDQVSRWYDLQVVPLAEGGRRLVFATDRTVETHMRNALIESRARFKDIVAISSDYSWETGADGSFTAISPKGLAGRGADQLIGSHPALLLDADKPAPAVLPFAAPAPLDGVELWLRHVDGRSLCFEVAAVPLYDQRGHWVGARGICRDVTEDRRQRATLAAQRNAERLFARITTVFHSQANPDDTLKMAASACTHGFGANGCLILATTTPLVKGVTKVILEAAASFGAVGTEAEINTVVARLMAEPTVASPRLLGTGSWSVLAAPTVYAGNLMGAVLLWRDVERPAWVDQDSRLLQNVAGQLAVAIQQRSDYHVLLDVSRTDPLTGLLNRRAFYEEVCRRFNRLTRSGQTAALVYADLDNFKLVNDVHGHERGDVALHHMADILRGNTRSVDLVARLGGDEFAVWLDNADRTVAVNRAKVFLAAAKPLIRYSGSPQKPLKVSFGIAVYDSSLNEDINEFISRADRAMYSVKRAGNGNFGLPATPRRR
ncbi:MAG TPA: diguanylate cyclase [Rhodospirillaceae bacterium]|nr:diguanylate cyclase [Rhodospirillaceae bacterium]